MAKAGKMITRKKVTTKLSRVDLTLPELEVVYIACSNYTGKKPKVQQRVVNKIRTALFNRVIKL